MRMSRVFFFNDTATTEIYTLSLHDALPILHMGRCVEHLDRESLTGGSLLIIADALVNHAYQVRSEEHTSELQSRLHLVCRLLLEKKKKIDDFAGLRTFCILLDVAVYTGSF